VGTSVPELKVLSDEDLEQVDDTARRLLKHVGVQLRGDNGGRYLDRLQKAGASVDKENQLVRFDGALIDGLMAGAPESFTLYSRDGTNDLQLGQGNIYFGNGGRVFHILDMGTGGYRLSLLRDVANTATLVDNLDHIQFYIIACQAHDIKPVNYHLLDFFYSLNHTAKHVMGGCTNLRGARQVHKLASIIAGGEDRLREKPFVSVITNTLCPLTVAVYTLDILDFCTAKGIPVTCASVPMAGATSPATLAGTLSQMHAGALAGMCIAQMFSPGAKVLYGAVPTTMDLRRMDFCMGSVEMAMMNAAAVQLAKRYALPIYASSGVTEAKRPDIQAGFEKTASNLMVGMAGGDFIHLAAGMLDSAKAISYEQYVIDDEIIGMVQHILRGIAVNRDTLAFDVIKEVGPGGNFVAEEHTVRHMMDQFYYPYLSVRSNFDIWEEKGRPDMLSRAKERVEEILGKASDGLLGHDTIARIQEAFPGSRMI